jgi:hypothetical protein
MKDLSWLVNSAENWIQALLRIEQQLVDITKECAYETDENGELRFSMGDNLEWELLNREERLQVLEKYVRWDGLADGDREKITVNVLADLPKHRWFEGIESRGYPTTEKGFDLQEEWRLQKEILRDVDSSGLTAAQRDLHYFKEEGGEPKDYRFWQKDGDRLRVLMRFEAADIDNARDMANEYADISEGDFITTVTERFRFNGKEFVEEKQVEPKIPEHFYKERGR